MSEPLTIHKQAGRQCATAQYFAATSQGPHQVKKVSYDTLLQITITVVTEATR